MIDASGGFAELMHQLEGGVDVLKHADGVGDDEVVERPLDLRQRLPIFGIADDELQVGVPLLCATDGGRAEIDADAVGRFQCGKQVAAAATKLQNALARRNQECMNR